MDAFELSEVIAKLRQDLARARTEGAGKDLRFSLDEIELEFQVVVTKEGNGKLGVKFLVIDAEAGGKYANAVTQKIKLKMKLSEKGGKDTEISGEDTR
jgi:hypothetical protein